MECIQEMMQKIPILRSSYKDLTKSERRIAEYICTNLDVFMNLTISEIAVHTGSSEITVSRFCKKLGFNGLQDFKIALARETQFGDEGIYEDIEKDDNSITIASKIFSNISDGLKDTLSLLDFSDVDKAVSLLDKANRVAAYGFGNSATVCYDIETRFIRFGIPVQAYSDAHQQCTSASFLKEGDVVIAVSHTGSTIELLEAVDVAKKNGANVIAITSHARSPLTKLADISLIGMGREVHYRSESVASRLIHIAISDLLYICLAMRHHDTYIKNIRRMRKIISRKRL